MRRGDGGLLDAQTYFRRRGARLTLEHARACIGRRRSAMATIEQGIDGIRPRRVPCAGAGSGGWGDPTVAAALWRMTTAREIYERAQVRVAEIDEFRAEATRLVEGIGKGLSERYATLLFFYYIDGMTWKEAAGAVGVSCRHASRLRDTACDWADAVGWFRAVRGLGMAG